MSNPNPPVRTSDTIENLRARCAKKQKRIDALEARLHAERASGEALSKGKENATWRAIVAEKKNAKLEHQRDVLIEVLKSVTSK